MTNGNESAYPHSDGNVAPEYGLTKREYFAAMAMQGYLANPTVHQGFNDSSVYATYAVEFADALIEALNTAESAGRTQDEIGIARCKTEPTDGKCVVCRTEKQGELGNVCDTCITKLEVEAF